jgi:hypothetical protein
MDKKFIYNHPAIMPDGIVLGEKYTLEELKKKFTDEAIEVFFKEVVDEVKETVKKK